MGYRDCFDCFRLRPGRCDNHQPKLYNCWGCGTSVTRDEAIQRDNHMWCEYCAEDGPLDGPAYDTPSLSDLDPEGHGFVSNRNPWGMEGGY